LHAAATADIEYEAVGFVPIKFATSGRRPLIADQSTFSNVRWATAVVARRIER